MAASLVELADSTTTSKKRKPSTVAEHDKIYVCSHPGCGKSFMRSDHLARHKLNHEPQQIFICDRCPRTFVRPDLLKRHAERHDKREQSGLQSQPKPGRIKGTTGTSKKRSSPKSITSHTSFTDGSRYPPQSPSIGSQFTSIQLHQHNHNYPPTNGYRHNNASASTSGGEYFESSAPNSAPDSIGSRNSPLPSPPIIDDYDHNRYTDLLAPRLRRSPSPESSANLLLDFSHLTDQLSFSNLLERINGPNGAISAFSSSGLPSTSNLGSDITSAQTTTHVATRVPPTPPAPPPPPPLPIFNMQGPSDSSGNGQSSIASRQENEPTAMDTSATAGPSNFNAAFDFGSTYAVASSNYDTPFLSASESNWLFNHADLQFDSNNNSNNDSGGQLLEEDDDDNTALRALQNGQHASSSLQNGGSSRVQPPMAQPTPAPPLPDFLQIQNHQHPQQRSAAPQFQQQQQQPQRSPYRPVQSLPVSNSIQTRHGQQGTPSPRNQPFPSLNQSSTPNVTTASSAFPSSLSSILNPSQRRNSRHVHFADASLKSPSFPNTNTSQGVKAANQNMINDMLQSGGETMHPPLPPMNGHTSQHLDNHNDYQQQQSYRNGSGSGSYQVSSPRTIKISLPTRNRLAKHLAGVPNLLSDNRFSPASLDEHLMRFFEWDACHYSVIHRATFEPDEAPNHLLAAMLAIGAYFTGPEAHALAEEIHKHNLQSMLSSPAFCARADMQTIQATLFLNVFGRLMSTYDDHEKAHILYPSFLTMYRRSALFNTRNTPVAPGADIHAKWVAWREEEESKRAAFMAYQFDIVCNTMFRQTGTLSAFQIQLTLPCEEDEWYAHSAFEWNKIHQNRTAPPPFLTTMKAFLMPGLNSPEISPLARVICLHGLLSVAFDMQWREYFLLGLSTHPDGLVKDWRPTLTSAYNCWKTRFDAALTQSPTAFGTQLLRNSIPIYAIAHVTLAVDVDELQIFAGKRRALGLPVPASVIDTTRRRIITWSGLRGKEAVWHAAHFVRSSLLTRRPYEDTTVHPIVLSWCLYLSCLCVHAYSTAVALTTAHKENAGAADPGDAMAYLDAICSSQPDAINLPGSGTAASVCRAVSRVLKEDVNWELAQEASQLLDKVALDSA